MEIGSFSVQLKESLPPTHPPTRPSLPPPPLGLYLPPTRPPAHPSLLLPSWRILPPQGGAWGAVSVSQEGREGWVGFLRNRVRKPVGKPTWGVMVRKEETNKVGHGCRAKNNLSM